MPFSVKERALIRPSATFSHAARGRRGMTDSVSAFLASQVSYAIALRLSALPGGGSLLPQRPPRRIVGDVDQLIADRSYTRPEDCDDLRPILAGIERGMHDTGRNESAIAGAKDALLAVEPLLDLSGEDE